MTSRTTRWAVFAVVVLFLAVGAALSDREPVVVVVCVLVALVAALFLQSTGWRLVVTCVVVGVAVTVLCAGVPSNIGWFDLCALAGWCALRGGAVPSGAFAAAVTALMAYQWVVVKDDGGWAAWIAGTVFTVAFALMARRQAELIDELRAAQAGLADQARVAERNRIARELHDVIGHALTVSQLHVSSARLAVEEDPGQAIASLMEAERLGEQSLNEVRNAVGLLREDGPSSTTPVPGIERLPALVDEFRRAGVEVSYEVVGDPGRLASTLAITIYRVLQEALTNAARHAPGAAISVRLDVSATYTVVTVDNAGGRVGHVNPTGTGLVSMKERAEIVGGHLTAGPSDAGWRVHVVLPGAPERAGHS